MEYVDGSSGIRNFRGDIYEKGVFRSGGNYGTIPSGETIGNGAASVSGGIGNIDSSSAIGIGGTARIGTTGGIGSTGYVQQRSTNYLSESRGSGVSGVQSLSRGELSSRSSKAGGVNYNYQEVYQK